MPNSAFYGSYRPDRQGLPTNLFDATDSTFVRYAGLEVGGERIRPSRYRGGAEGSREAENRGGACTLVLVSV